MLSPSSIKLYKVFYFTYVFCIKFQSHYKFIKKNKHGPLSPLNLPGPLGPPVLPGPFSPRAWPELGPPTSYTVIWAGRASNTFHEPGPTTVHERAGLARGPIGPKKERAGRPGPAHLAITNDMLPIETNLPNFVSLKCKFKSHWC